MACCRCCEKTGACCNDGVCTQETCADCEDAGGLFQGVDTECVGANEDECPCDPPADPGQCEKCVEGYPEVYCPEYVPNCCDGVCQAEPCGCSGDCEWSVVWGLEGAYGWTLETGCVGEDCLCAEPEDDPGTEESPAQEGNYFTPCQECLEDADCDAGQVCCDGVCQECCEDADCGEGENCCDGACQEEACSSGCLTGYSASGWFTSGGVADLTALLQAAGYVDVAFTPAAPFSGATVPYTDGCGLTFYNVSAACCGQTFGCTPSFTSGNVSSIAGGGNQSPPCGEPVTEENFVDTCCNPF